MWLLDVGSKKIGNDAADQVVATIARKWFEEVIACYIYDQGHNEALTDKEKKFYAGLGIDLINYSKNQKFNIEDIEIN